MVVILYSFPTVTKNFQQLFTRTVEPFQHILGYLLQSPNYNHRLFIRQL
jgi:hypothetical protein